MPPLGYQTYFIQLAIQDPPQSTTKRHLEDPDLNATVYDRHALDRTSEPCPDSFEIGNQILTVGFEKGSDGVHSMTWIRDTRASEYRRVLESNLIGAEKLRLQQQFLEYTSFGGTDKLDNSFVFRPSGPATPLTPTNPSCVIRKVRLTLYYILTLFTGIFVSRD